MSFLGTLQPDAIITHAQITDLYLLALAAHRHGKLATFGRAIPTHAVAGGPEALELLAG